MNKLDAIETMLKGKKITKKDWNERSYLYMHDNKIYDENGMEWTTYFFKIFTNKDNSWTYWKPIKDVRIFLSLPMNGRSEEEIIDEKNSYIEGFKKFLEEKENCEIHITDVNDDIFKRPKDFNRLDNLAASIMHMGSADYVVFVRDYSNDKGCRIELETVTTYYNEDFWKGVYYAFDCDTFMKYRG